MLLKEKQYLNLKLKINEMYITIPTIFREKENYLSTMLDDMITKDPECLKNNFGLFIGNNYKLPELSELFFHTAFSEQASFDLEYLSNFEWSCMEDRTVNVRFNMNFMRCMSSTLCNSDILYLEDDIEFSQNWFTKLETYIKQLDEEYNKQYILSLYSPWRFNHSRLVDKIPSGHYYGTQGVYIKAKYQKELFHKIFKDGVVNFKHQADLLLDEFAKEHNIPILALTKSLIQHKGKESTGLGNYHWTENFQG